MIKKYLFYLLQMTKALGLVGFLFPGVLFFQNIFFNDGKLNIFHISVGILWSICVTVIFFLMPLLVSSLFRYLLQKHTFISSSITFLIFYGYGYLLFFSTDERYMQYNPQEGFKYFMLFVTLIFIGLSEWFIYRAQKHNSES